MSDPVLGYAGYAHEAEQTYGVPAAVLLGLTSVESGGNALAVSSAGAKGSTQFLPSTASSYGVQFGDSPDAKKSQIFGAARYLVALGYHANPQKALASYNAGPNNWQAGLGYARTVLARAKGYGHVGSTVSPDTAAAAGQAVASGAQAVGGNPLNSLGQRALHGLVGASLVTGAAFLIYFGAARATGLHPARLLKKAPVVV